MSDAVEESGQDKVQGRNSLLPKWGWSGLIGLPILVLAWFLNEWEQAWWNNTLTNVGVTSLFIIPAAIIGHSFSNWKQSVNDRTTAAETKAEAATTEASAATKESQGAKADVEILSNALSASEGRLSSLDSIREQFLAEQVAEADNEQEIYAELAKRGDRSSLLHVLRHGTDTGLISERGLRSPIWETGLHYRFYLEKETLLVIIENDAGHELAEFAWDEHIDEITFYKKLLKAVQKLGAYQGVMTFDPTQNMESIAESLEYASRFRSQKMLMGTENVRDIIEFVEGWYITEEGMFPKGREHYLIEAHRLWSLDWEEHIMGKRWDVGNIVAAIAVARALHASKNPAKATAGATK
ncbi:hypothetical protein [Arthrobacter oryzae]|uniref:hypothetical protein n=1 Tax=Arthrobacter oryzae TaxID=409290 RepID=UPI0030C9BDDF